MRGAWLLGLLLSACGWPAGLPETAAPGLMRGGMAYPDLRATATRSSEGRGDAAVIIAIEDYTRLAARPHAQEMAAAWYRYFRETRRIRPRRISLLRGAEATPDAVAQALEDAHARVGRRGTVWFVFVGHVSSAAPGKYGVLWLRDGDGTAATKDTAVSLTQVLRRLGHGMHPRTIAVLDGCLAPAAGSGTETPGMPGYVMRGAADVLPVFPMLPIFLIPTLAEEVEMVEWFVERDVVRGRREPTDVAVFSAGYGARCTEDLPGTKFPALSYLVLGALRGWADRNGDGSVSAFEVITQATEMLRAAHHGSPGASPGPSSYSADITLARGVSERAPDVRGLLPPDVARTFPVATLLKEPVLWRRDTMVRFARGRFKMGCPWRGDTDCEKDERPRHGVFVSRFAIDPLEVTVAEYAACVAAGACDAVDVAKCFVWTGAKFIKGAAMDETLTRAQHPAVCVSWYQAQRYCEAYGRRLPTEAEWERAAAGTTRRRFPWGEAAPDCTRAHFDGCGEHTRPVGTRPAGATAEGVHDLSGNAAEWVHDWYARDMYEGARNRDPTGAMNGTVRVVRGGSYYDGPALLRSAYRYGLNPMASFSTVGFRCAR